MARKRTKLELITTQHLTDISTSHFAKLLKTTPGKVNKYLRGDVTPMTKDDEMLLASEVKNSLYRASLGYFVDELEIVSYHDCKGRPIDDKKSGYHSQVKITRKYVKPELGAIDRALEKLDPGFLNQEPEDKIVFIDDIPEDFGNEDKSE